jgi:hypothetical protein
MIMKGKSISHGFNLIRYIMTKDDARLISSNGVEACDPEMVWLQMSQEIKDHHLKSGIIRMEISPTPEQSKGFRKEDWLKLSDDILRRLDAVYDGVRVENGRNKEGKMTYRTLHSNLHGSRRICYLHSDSKSGILHLHLAVSRVDMGGRVNSDNLMGRRACVVNDLISLDRGWELPSEVSKDNRQTIAEDCRSVLAMMVRFSWDEYERRLKERGYEIQLRKDKSDKVCAYSIKKGNSLYKISEVDRHLMASQILRTWYSLRPEGRTTAASSSQSARQKYIRVNPSEFAARITDFSVFKNRSGTYSFRAAIDGSYFLSEKLSMAEYRAYMNHEISKTDLVLMKYSRQLGVARNRPLDEVILSNARRNGVGGTSGLLRPYPFGDNYGSQDGVSQSAENRIGEDDWYLLTDDAKQARIRGRGY